jgi:hypothetical protein
MQQSKVVRRIACGAVGAAVAAGGAVAGLSTPAYAVVPPASHQRTGAYDASPAKRMIAECPAGQRVFGAGGRINDGGGAVILTHVVPDPTLSFVSVAGTARAGHTGKWSITAVAVCAPSIGTLERTIATAEAPTATTAACAGQGQLSGAGFRIDDPADGAYLTELAPDANLRRVRVSAGGPFAAPATVTAIGICHSPTSPAGSSEESVTFDGTWPKTATAGKDPTKLYVYGVAGRVEGPADVFLDGLVPSPETDRAAVHAVRAGTTGAAREMADGGGGSATSTALCGTFY